MKNEEWKDILGYEGFYQISNLGKVKSLTRKVVPVDKILKPQVDGNGYLHARLYKDGKGKTMKVHQLVVLAFLNHVPNGHKVVVDHIDNNKLNNKLNNLQLISNRENISKDKIGGTSKHVGVSWNKEMKKWYSCIRINSKTKSLGLFTCELEASEAYQKKLKQITNK